MKASSVFVRDGGLRAGWRLLMWLAIFVGMAAGVRFVIIKVFHPREAASLAVSFG